MGYHYFWKHPYMIHFWYSFFLLWPCYPPQTWTSDWRKAFIVQMPFLMPMMQMVPAAPVQRYMPLEGPTSGFAAPVEMKVPATWAGGRSLDLKMWRLIWEDVSRQVKWGSFSGHEPTLLLRINASSISMMAKRDARAYWQGIAYNKKRYDIREKMKKGSILMQSAGLAQICIYIFIFTWNPNDLYVWRSTPQNKAFSNQNKGHLGCRYIYI